MAFANIFSSAQKPEDLTTPSSTPPPPTGVQTPQPDPHDKRFPTILSSYFSQVRESFQSSTNPPPSSSSNMRPASPVTPASEPDGRDRAVSRMSLDGKVGAGNDDTKSSSHLNEASLDGSQGQLLDPRSRDARKNEAQHAYPTPPLSSASSITKSERDGHSGHGSSRSASPAHAGGRSPSRRKSAMESLPSALSRANPSTAPSAAPSSSTSTPTVFASHISKSRPSQATVSRNSASASHQLSAALQHSEDSRLTEDAAKPRNQTPPRTPRTLSHDSKPTNSTNTQTSNTSAPPQTQQDGTVPLHRTGSTDDALMGQTKGKLSIQISSGRGLRPSVDPYVVCQFQYNEYISKGPRSDSSGASDSDGAADGVHAQKGGLPMQRSDSGRPMAIPMSSRQSSSTSISRREGTRGKMVTDPVWNHEAVFDVVGDQNEIDISVYDRSDEERFLGHVRFCPSIQEPGPTYDKWLKLEPRGSVDDQYVAGEVHLRLSFQHADKKHYGPEDFQILKLIGKGTFGQVFQVRKRDTQRVYAMKVLSKKVIVQKKEVAHTVGERNILVRTAMADSPFIVGLKFSFQTPTDLYLVTDYMSGGELFWHLQKESRFQEDRAKFYIAELILALQHLHDHDIVYRDLKPENILLDANGHIALCDFGLSKANLTKDDTTNTFCGTTEYLAPEVLLDEAGYTKMVDFWSLGVLVFEMVCGWSPFYAEDTQQMYKNIAFGKVRFPRDALSAEGRNFVKGLLNRNPRHRLGADGDAEQLKQHPFFADVDWDALAKKNLVPPFKPRLTSETDTSNFDPEFTNALNGASSLNARAAALAVGGNPATTPLSPTMQANFHGFTYVDESAISRQMRNDGVDDAMMDEDADITTGGVDGVDGATAGPPSPTLSRSSRMSGIQTGGGEEGMFGMG